VDVTFHLRLNRWQGQEQLQLELKGLRASTSDTLVLQRQQRQYWVRREGEALVIRNAAGEELRGRPDHQGDGEGVNPESSPADHPYVRALFREAAMAMGLAA
jgi:single-stranded-DNA-specific exonuclease